MKYYEELGLVLDPRIGPLSIGHLKLCMEEPRMVHWTSFTFLTWDKLVVRLKIWWSTFSLFMSK